MRCYGVQLGSQDARFICKEFGLIIELKYAHWPTMGVKNSTHISNTYFSGKRKLTKSDLITIFDSLVCTNDNFEDDDNKLKLTLFLKIVILSKENNNTFDPIHISMVDDLECFNTYP